MKPADLLKAPSAPPDPLRALDEAFPGLRRRMLPGFLVPPPYQALLVHDQDMTSTLERFHRESLFLEPLSATSEEGLLQRNVLLVGESSGVPRELGAITIYVHRFAPEPAAEILESRKPLGAILTSHRIAYNSRPEEFLELEPTKEILTALRLEEASGVLYGRRNSLRLPGGELLADVLEILPPLE